MQSINAIWTNGQIVPDGPVDWPEGVKLIVEPVTIDRQSCGMTEERWCDPSTLADWEAAVRSIPPLEFAPGELADIKEFEDRFHRFNLEVMRRQMESGENP